MAEREMNPATTGAFPIPPLIVAALGLLVVVGSMGPWASIWIITVNGTEGDGVFTLLLGLGAGLLALVRLARPHLRRRLMWIACVALGLSAAVGVYDWADLESTAGDPGALDVNVSVGWGLVVVTVGSFIGAVLAGRDAATRPDPEPFRF